MTERLYDLADRQAEQRPEATAVVLDGEALTYGRLAEDSDRLAWLLRDAGCEPGDRIALAMAKSPRAVLAMHAIMKAGCIYVPLDIASPAARVGRVVDAADARLILAEAGTEDLLEELLADRDVTIGWLGEDAPDGDRVGPRVDRLDLASMRVGTGTLRARSTEIAHLLFTSGSTGIPKGVIITHANVLTFVRWAVAYFGMDASDRVSGHSPLHFDLSSFDIYGALAAGAELHQVDPGLNLMAPKLAAFMRDSRLTQWFSVPSILTYLAKFEVIERNDLPELERLLWCGEVLPTPTLIHWMERLRHVTFTNLYGPTEATIASSYHTLERIPTDPAEAIPIGRACEGEELLILDERLAPVADGSTGDLYIGGVGLSPGYWRDPAKTEDAFRSFDAEDGRRIYRTGDLASLNEDDLAYFHGRIDTQIKSRGHRIELGEIETALGTIGDLLEHAVVAIPTEGFEGTRICCAYVPADGRAIGPRELRAELGRLVPSYMIPSRWRSYERLPKNANGKVDRPAIRDGFADAR